MSLNGTNSPFAALHKCGSYRGFICRAFATDGPADRDPKLSRLVSIDYLAGRPSELTISRAASRRSARCRAANSSTVKAVPGVTFRDQCRTPAVSNYAAGPFSLNLSA
jgi:hypothetical protein